MEKEHAATIKKLGGGEVKVIFNPTQYQLSESNQFAEIAVPGLDSPPLQFVRGAARTLSMQLFFDTYDPVLPDVAQGSDVRTYTGQVIDLLKVDSNTHAPPVVQFTWGTFSFIGVVERADQRFTMFNREGTPLRATMDVSFKELGQVQAAQARFSADFAKRHVVQRGETLSSIAAEHYDDPAQWRPIARQNNLADPLDIAPGQVLIIPPLTTGRATKDDLGAARRV